MARRVEHADKSPGSGLKNDDERMRAQKLADKAQRKMNKMARILPLSCPLVPHFSALKHLLSLFWRHCFGGTVLSLFCLCFVTVLSTFRRRFVTVLSQNLPNCFNDRCARV